MLIATASTVSMEIPRGIPTEYPGIIFIENSEEEALKILENYNRSLVKFLLKCQVNLFGEITGKTW